MTNQARQPMIVVDDDISLCISGERDADELFALIEQNRLHLRAWLPWLDSTKTVEDERVFLRSMQEQYAAHEAISFIIRHHEQAAGAIGLRINDKAHRAAEIGYWLSKDYEGKGIMTRACRAVVAYAFHEWHVNRVQIRCATGNTRSCAIPQRLGFAHEGIMRQAEWLYDHFVDLALYSMLASEWH